MRFTKMHGLGNDYVYVDGTAQRVADPAGLARVVSDRHTGIGGDGLILILPPTPGTHADVRMRMFNADGSEAEMCGNGIRCVAKYAWDHGLARANPLRVETGRGVLAIDLHLAGGKVARATVNMGRPVLELEAIPADPTYLRPVAAHTCRLTDSLELGGGSGLTLVSMGNPHAVIFVDDVAAVDVARLGPQLEHHRAFPRRINVHWVQVQGPGEWTMRTWERGSGITQACGTGACAVCVAAALTGRAGRQVTGHLPGGDLQLDWRATDDCVYMTGPAVEVFTGEWPDTP
jgi:diaminopimelate epimerase